MRGRVVQELESNANLNSSCSRSWCYAWQVYTCCTVFYFFCWSGGGGWVLKVRIRLSQLSTNMRLKLKLSLAIYIPALWMFLTSSLNIKGVSPTLSPSLTMLHVWARASLLTKHWNSKIVRTSLIVTLAFTRSFWLNNARRTIVSLFNCLIFQLPSRNSYSQMIRMR